MRKSRTLWSLFTTGMQFALNQWLKTQNKALLSFQYPGSSATAQKKFATLETEAGINARHEFHVQWLKDFLQLFSAQDQRAVLRVIAGVVWRMPQERKLHSNDVLGLTADIHDALENLELAGVDRVKLREGVLAKFGEENGGDDKLMQEIAKAGQEADTWEDMLTRLVQDLVEAERVGGLSGALDDLDRKRPGEEHEHQAQGAGRKDKRRKYTASEWAEYRGHQKAQWEEEQKAKESEAEASSTALVVHGQDMQDNKGGNKGKGDGKGYGKGYAKGYAKGGGKGKKVPGNGQGCYICGGAHFQDNCDGSGPWGAKGGKGGKGG